jgi:hypothetical protein
LAQAILDGGRLLTGHAGVRRFDMVGSCLYHPTPNDVDFLVLADGDRFISVGDTGGEGNVRWMFGSDWNLCGEYDDQYDKWGAIRRGLINLIVTVDQGWYGRMLMASRVCEALKLMDKADRIVVHRVVRDRYSPDEANARRDGSR